MASERERQISALTVVSQKCLPASHIKLSYRTLWPSLTADLSLVEHQNDQSVPESLTDEVYNHSASTWAIHHTRSLFKEKVVQCTIFSKQVLDSVKKTSPEFKTKVAEEWKEQEGQ